MLCRLSIENLAIIEACAIEFEPGLNIMTGETGAGKSIVIAALNLVLGERASPDDVRTGARMARVEGVFDLRDAPQTRKALEERGLLSGEPGVLIIRREIQAGGKSRHFINGASVQLAEVRDATRSLVDLHGQHQHQSLLDIETHREALDAFGEYAALLAECARLHGEFTRLAARLRSLVADERQIERDKDMLRFQAEEIEGAHLEPGEDEALAIERNRLANAETLRLSLHNALDRLYEGEESEASAAQLLGEALGELERLARIDPTLAPLNESLASARATLEDAAQELRAYRDKIEADPARLQEVEDRLDQIKKLKRKYGDTIEAVLAQGAAYRQRLASLENREAEIAATQKALDEARRELGRAAQELTARRQATATQWVRRIEKNMAQLGMPQSRCSVSIRQMDAVDNADGVAVNGRAVAVASHGADVVELLISPNPGEELRPLRKIASGGELSRIMLVLKSIMAAKDQVPTLVFDEVDAGISGVAASRVGDKLEALAQSRQVVCVTHLPQIAARGAVHLCADKTLRAGRTVCTVRRLSAEERLDEIAKLFSGEQATPESREHARALLSRR